MKHHFETLPMGTHCVICPTFCNHCIPYLMQINNILSFLLKCAVFLNMSGLLLRMHVFFVFFGMLKLIWASKG